METKMKKRFVAITTASLTGAVMLTGCVYAPTAGTDPASSRSLMYWNDLSDMGRDMACSGSPASSARSLVEIHKAGNGLQGPLEGLSDYEARSIVRIALTNYCP